MQMPGRQISSSAYRYGFNGKENDNEVKGNGNQQDYGMRIYDPRIGKFLSVDPLYKSYPWWSPYHFAGDKPIWANDLDGLEPNYPGTLHDYVPTLSNTDANSLAPKEFGSAHFDAMHMFYADNIDGINGTKVNNRPKFINLLQKQFGGFDCITTMIAAEEILFNNFGLNVQSNNGNVLQYCKNLEKWGYATHNESDFYKVSTGGKKIGEIATRDDFKMSISLGDKIMPKVASDGIYFFNMAIGVDYHAMMIIAKTVTEPVMDPATGQQQQDADGKPMTTTKTTFYKADEIGTGWSKLGDAAALDKYIAGWHWYNSTEEDTKGNRVMSGDAKNKLNEGREQGTFYQLQKLE